MLISVLIVVPPFNRRFARLAAKIISLMQNFVLIAVRSWYDVGFQAAFHGGFYRRSHF
jgi:hypothetical protein